MAATDRGIDFEGVKEFELGHVVDYCIDWNEAHDPDEKKKKKKKAKRKATQADWNAFLG